VTYSNALVRINTLDLRSLVGGDTTHSTTQPAAAAAAVTAAVGAYSHVYDAGRPFRHSKCATMCVIHCSMLMLLCPVCVLLHLP
jgi:hypothetical protein